MRTKGSEPVLYTAWRREKAQPGAIGFEYRMWIRLYSIVRRISYVSLDGAEPTASPRFGD